MNRFNFFVAFAVALIASGPVLAYSSQGGYGGGAAVEAPSSGDYQLQGINSNDASSASASALAGDANSGNILNAANSGSLSNAANSGSLLNAANSGSLLNAANSGGLLNAGQSIPYSPANTRGNSVTSSITYPQNKGEILIHRPAPIIVKRPPTKVLVNHPPLVVKPAPVVLHKPPAVVVRKVYVKQHPRPVKVEPVYVNVVKPPAEKYFVKEQNQINGSPLAPIPAGFQPLAPGGPGQPALGNLNAGLGAAVANGALNFAQFQNLQGLGGVQGVQGLPISNGDYQLLNGQGLSLANLAPGGYGQSANQYGAPGY